MPKHHPLLLLTAAVASGSAALSEESPETAPVRPEGGAYVPPPFVAVSIDKESAACGERRYALSGAVPMPVINGHSLLRRGEFRIDGRTLSPPGLEWKLQTPAVSIAERSWTDGPLRIFLRQTVEYDGFVTCDLELAPASGPVTIRELTLELEYAPKRSVLYQIPATSSTPAGLWPAERRFDLTIPGVWGGDDTLGFASYAATFRNWRGAGCCIEVRRAANGPGMVVHRVVTERTTIDAPVSYRFGFIATPVRAPEPRHWQLCALRPGSATLDATLNRILFWSDLSDRYATFRTNRPEDDAAKAAKVRALETQGRTALAYTTYAHVEEGAVPVPPAWGLVTAKGKISAGSIGGSGDGPRRVFCCPGSREWAEWKIADLDAAIGRYGVEGFYVDTSYVILACANAEHGHGWTDAGGARQTDCLTWSMRRIWRGAYELLCRKRGHAVIYAHHKGGCPPALAAFTTAFCDGEQYCGSQSIRNLTLDAFRAQIAGRNMGPLALFLCEYYRAAHYGVQERSGHHNPAESAMLSLLHDVLPTGYPGNHPVSELISLRDDLGLTDAAWMPYHAAGNPWAADGAAISSYRTKRGDTLLVAGNPAYEPVRTRLTGPSDATRDRAFVAIDVLHRVGRSTEAAPGYRWEPARAEEISIPARSLALFAWMRQPESLPAFAARRGFATSPAEHARRTPIPDGAVLLDDFEDPDWEMTGDEGDSAITRENPVDTARALRVMPKPLHSSAALLRAFPQPRDWSACTELTFSIRPDNPLPARALEVRLRDPRRYGPPLRVTAPDPKAVLPPGKWTELRCAFGTIPRGTVTILRLYYNRGELASGAFAVDEMLLWGTPKLSIPAAHGKPAHGKNTPPGTTNATGPQALD